MTTEHRSVERTIDRDRLANVLDGIDLDVYDTIGAFDSIGYAEAIVEAYDAIPDHEPGAFHEYRTICVVCGQRGQVHLSLEPQRSQLRISA
jgi:hypothetical protein